MTSAAPTAGPASPPTATPAATGAFGYPIFLDLRDRLVLVAGGGWEPRAKAEQLLALGARVRLWALEHRHTAALGEEPAVDLVTGELDADALFRDATLAIVATGDRVLDRTLAAHARARRVLVNTMDDVPACDWSAPAILRRGDLTIAVGTGGIAPALAVRLRDRFAAEVGPAYSGLLDLFRQLRPTIMATGRPFRDRRALWYELVDGPALGLLDAGDVDGARTVLHARVDAWMAEP